MVSMSNTSGGQQRPQRTWRRPSVGYMGMTEEVLATAPDSWLIAWSWHERAFTWLKENREDDPHALYLSTTALLKSVPPDDRAAFDAAIGRRQAEQAALGVPAEPLDTDPFALLVNKGPFAGRGLRMVKYAQRANMELRFAELLDHKEPTPPPPDAPRWTWRLYHLVRDLHEIFQGTEQQAEQDAPSQSVDRTRTLLPHVRPQYTFAEANADAPRLHHWMPLQDEESMRHAIEEGAPLEVKFPYSALLQAFGIAGPDEQSGLSADQRRQKVYGVLKDALCEMGLTANMTFHICMAALLEQTYPEIALDDLIAAVGLDPRSSEERGEMRSQMWHWLRVFSCWEIIGKRKGTYRDPSTRQLIDLQATESLFHISGRKDPDGDAPFALYDSRAPLIVTLARSAWLDRVAGNDRILAYFGDIRKLAVIPGGKTSGAWARAIGMALNQIWREEATRTEVVAVGEDRKLTARCRPFTRRELLTMFTPTPSVEEVLGGSSPKRVLEYWSGAITFLKRDIIGYISEPEPPSERKGRYAVWLDQEVDIRPARDGVADIAAMAKRAAAGRKKRGRPHTTRPRGGSKLGE